MLFVNDCVMLYDSFVRETCQCLRAFRVCVFVCDLMCNVVRFGLLWFCVVESVLCYLFDVFVPLVVSCCLVLCVCFCG